MCDFVFKLCILQFRYVVKSQNVTTATFIFHANLHHKSDCMADPAVIYYIFLNLDCKQSIHTTLLVRSFHRGRLINARMCIATVSGSGTERPLGFIRNYQTQFLCPVFLPVGSMFD